jgi:uncharacterized membrane protein
MESNGMSIENINLKDNSELRSNAREQLGGNWGGAIISCVIFSIISSAASGAAGIGSLILGGPLELGLATYFLQLKRQKKVQLEVLFQGFRNFEAALILYIARMIFTFLWSLLLIIPGIIAALKFSMAVYILHDNPELSGMDAINRSKEMMDGLKGKLFGLYLSFLGWAILCLFTFGIGYLWLFPYMKATEANFYEDLKNAQK